MDGEILSHAHVNWISDQPGALRKLAIHFGSQLAHPAVECNDWLIEWPPGSIAMATTDRGCRRRWIDCAAICLSPARRHARHASASARRSIAGRRATSRTAAAHVALYVDQAARRSSITATSTCSQRRRRRRQQRLGGHLVRGQGRAVGRAVRLQAFRRGRQAGLSAARPARGGTLRVTFGSARRRAHRRRARGGLEIALPDLPIRTLPGRAVA